jgi:hypothetical protein
VRATANTEHEIHRTIAAFPKMGLLKDDASLLVVACRDLQSADRRNGPRACFLGNAMQFSRRLFLRLAAGVAALSASSRITQAQAYPSRPVRLIVGLAAGGGQDIVARLMGQWLSDRLGRQFIIENRPGASGNLALEAVANAE